MMPTGVTEELVRTRILLQGCECAEEELVEVLGSGPHPFMAFKVTIQNAEFFFVVPRALGPDGYRVWELEVIEEELMKYDVELLPLDGNSMLH